MADRIVYKDYQELVAGALQPAKAIPIKLHDNGDGTWSEATPGSGGGGGGGAVTVADGADTAEGATTDAVVAAGAVGTVSAKLRRLTTDIGTLIGTIGNKVSASSLSTTVASDDAQFGTEYTGYTQDTGGSGVRGLLSTIAKAVRGVLSTNTADLSAASATINILNANPNSGSPTAGSVVTLALGGGQNLAVICITANSLGASATLQLSWDNSNWFNTNGLTTISAGTTSSFATIATGTTGTFQVATCGAKAVRIAANTATVSGTLTASITASTASAPFVQNVVLNSLGASIASMSAAGGTTAVAQAIMLANAGTNTDYSAQAWAATSGNGATITDAAGAVCAFDISVTVYTAGSSTGTDIILEQSPDGGTTWYPVWHVEAITTTGHYYIPPVYIAGARRRMRWVNRTGAATTVTVTVTANRMSVAPAFQRQFMDRTAGLLAGTGPGASFDISGARNVTALITIGAATTPGTYQLQASADGSNWANVGSTQAATATSTVSLSVTGVSFRFMRVNATGGSAQTGTFVAILAS